MEERENFYRFSALLLNVGGKVLREVFTFHHLKSNTLAAYLCSHKNRLRTIPPNVLSQKQRNILFPSNGNTPIIEELDITLLCILFRSLDSTHQSNSPVWSIPSGKCTSFQADIGRIKGIRNVFFGHLTSASLDNLTFKTEASNLETIYHRLISSLPASQFSPTDLQQLIEKELKDPIQPELESKIRTLKEEESQQCAHVSIKLTMKVMTKDEKVIDAEMKIEDIFAKDPEVFSSDLRSAVIDVERGSVIITLQPLSKHAQDTLVFFCQHGGMKDYILNLLRNKDVFDSLPNGEVCIEVEVSCHKDQVSEGTHNPQEEVEVVDNPKVIKENLLLQYGSLLEEIEPLQLQDTFIGKGIIGKSFFEDLTKLQRRARAADFLNTVLHIGNDALIALVVALTSKKRKNIATKLCSVQKKIPHIGHTEQVDDTLVQVIGEVSKMHADENVLWSCRLDLLIQRQPYGIATIRNLTHEDLRKKWQSVETLLLEELDPRSILSFFTFFSENECHAILNQKTRRAMVQRFLIGVKENIPDAFSVLLSALNKSGREYLVHSLMNTIHGIDDSKAIAHVSNIPSINVKLGVMTKDESISENAEKQIKDNFPIGSLALSSDLESVVMDVGQGSVIIRLQPLSKHAQETLSFFCRHGGMKEYVLNILRKKVVFASLPKGEVCIMIEVSCHKDALSEGVHKPQEAFESEGFEAVDNPKVIKENLLLQYGSLLEEIEPTHLQEIFISRGIISKNDFKDFKNLQRRARVAAFFNKVLHAGNDALVALVVALKGSGRENLATKLCYQKKTPHLGDTEQVDDSMVQIVGEVPQMHVDEAMLWSCRLDLLIAMHRDEEQPHLRSELEAIESKSDTDLEEQNVTTLNSKADGNDWYPGVVCLPEHKLLLVDCGVNAAKLYDRSTGDLLTESDRMKSRPWDVCIFDESMSQVAVALGNGTIEILSVQSTGPVVIIPVRTIKTKLKVCHAVRTMTIGDQLIVSGRSAQGLLCWCIISTLDEEVTRIHTICKYGALGSCYMALNKEKWTVYFSCAAGAKSGNTGVYGYDVESGLCKVKYHHKDLPWPKGICLDNMGCIYICNQYPPCIHKLTENGAQVQVFKKGISSMPRAICLDENRNFLVTWWKKNLISRFEMLWNKQDVNDWYPGVVCLPGQKLLLVDCRVKTAKLYDRNTGNLLTESDRMKSRPWDVCVFDESMSQVAVALGNGTIQILSVQSTGPVVIIPVRTIQTKLKVCHAVRTMTVRDQLIVSGRSAKGHLCWGVISTSDEKVDRMYTICDYGSLGSCYMALNKEQSTVYLSCATGAKSGNTGVYGYDLVSGSRKVKYQHKYLPWPKGICLDNMGYIYVCNQYPPCIHKLTENGEPVRVFKKGISSMPRAICLDENTNFLSTCWNENRISIFRMLWNKQDVEGGKSEGRCKHKGEDNVSDGMEDTGYGSLKEMSKLDLKGSRLEDKDKTKDEDTGLDGMEYSGYGRLEQKSELDLKGSRIDNKDKTKGEDNALNETEKE